MTLIFDCETTGLIENNTVRMAKQPEVIEFAAAPPRQAGQVVVYLAYGKQETALVAAARAAGCDVVDGREALVRQGAASFRIWTGIDAPVEVMRAAVRAG